MWKCTVRRLSNSRSSSTHSIRLDNATKNIIWWISTERLDWTCNFDERCEGRCYMLDARCPKAVCSRDDGKVNISRTNIWTHLVLRSVTRRASSETNVRPYTTTTTPPTIGLRVPGRWMFLLCIHCRLQLQLIMVDKYLNARTTTTTRNRCVLLLKSIKGGGGGTE